MGGGSLVGVMLPSREEAGLTASSPWRRRACDNHVTVTQLWSVSAQEDTAQPRTSLVLTTLYWSPRATTLPTLSAFTRWSKGANSDVRKRVWSRPLGNAAYVACLPLLHQGDLKGGLVVSDLQHSGLGLKSQLTPVLLSLSLSTSQHQNTPSQPMPLRVQDLATLYQELMSAMKQRSCSCDMQHLRHATSLPMQHLCHATSFLCQLWRCGAEPNLSDTLHSIITHSICCHGNTNGLLTNTHHTWAVPMHLYRTHTNWLIHNIKLVALVAMVRHSTWSEYHITHIKSA